MLQLQEEAAGSLVTTTELLRKALIVARKLGIVEFQRWIGCELNGYAGAQDPVPSYRRVNGELRAQNPVRGWIPVVWEDAAEAQIASQSEVRQSVTELEQLCEAKGNPMMRMSHLEQFGRRQMPIYLCFSKPSLQGILGTVRNAVLTWALDLEERGILGEGITFSVHEKKAADGANYSVTNFFGSGAIVQFHHGAGGEHVQHARGLEPSDLAHLVAALRESTTDVDQEHGKELAALIAELQAQATSKKPDTGKVKAALAAIRDLAATGGVAVELAQKVSEFLAHLG